MHSITTFAIAGASMGLLAGIALWRVSSLSLELELYPGGGTPITHTAPIPDNVATIQGLPAAWALVILPMLAGVIIGAAAGWVLAKLNWRIIHNDADASS